MQEVFDIKRIVKNASGMAFATLMQAGCKIITIPLLLTIYGQDHFGLLSLALSINLYLEILSLGIPGSLVKFVSSSFKDHGSLTRICRSSNSFFLSLGLLHFIILFFFGLYGSYLFKFSVQDTAILRSLFIIASFSALIYWPGSFLDSLMTAREDLVALSFFRVTKSIFELIGIILICKGCFELDIVQFFIFQLICIHMFFPFKVWRIIKLKYPYGIFIPAFYWKTFKPILYFSSSLLVVHVVSATAEHIKPILLAIQNPDSPGIVANYRILFTIVNFALLGAGFLRTSLLPSISRAYSSNLFEEANDLVQRAASIGWAILALPLFIGICLAPQLLEIYVGKEYIDLSLPLRIWLFSVSVQLYNGPGFAAVMGGGNIKLFAFSILISGILSILFLWLTVYDLGIVSVALSSIVLNSVHMFLLHTFVLNSVPKLQVKSLFFKAYLPPVLAGSVAFILAEIFTLRFETTIWLMVMIKIGIVSLSYITLLSIFHKNNLELKKIIKSTVARI